MLINKISKFGRCEKCSEQFIRSSLPNMSVNIEFKVNGEKCLVDARVPRDTSLNTYLRYYLGLPGTKAMCHQGICGSCIVSVRGYNHTTGKVETFSVNSCLVLVFTCKGWEITTIEGLGNKHKGYHEIQKRTTTYAASQCGYCTSGWEMHLYSLLDKKLTMAELEDSFGSNTCRCTGYRPILDTVKSFGTDASEELCAKLRDIEELNCCKTNKKSCERKCSTSSVEEDWSVIDKIAVPPPDSEVIHEIHFGVNGKTNNQKYFKVYNEAQIFEVFNRIGIDSYMLLDGNTGRGVTGIYDLPSLIVDIREVKSLKQYEFDQNLILGANISLEDCIDLFKKVAKERAEFAYLNEFVKHISLVANIPVRKIGSLAGNLMTKHKKPSFQSDIFVLLAGVGATLTVKYMFGSKKQLTMEEFLKADMVGALITKVTLPPFGRTYIFRSYKILPRSQTSTAIVNAAFLVKITSSNIVEKARLVYGNISDTFVRATRTETYLVGKNIFSNSVVKGAVDLLNTEVVPTYDAEKQSVDCRRKMAIGLFYKFILNICPSSYASSSLRSGGQLLERPLSSGKQDYTTDPTKYPLTQPLEKYEGMIQTAGEAQYANDLPPMKGEVFGAFVMAKVHNAELDCIDGSKALEMDGVLALFTAEDIPGKNSFGFPGLQLQVEDEEILASSKILFYGQPVAIIVADSQVLAAKAATLVEVTYKNVSSTAPVLTIDEAKKDSKRLISSDYKIEPTARGTNIKKVIKGVFETGGQYHYYMEPLSCVVIPVERGLEVHDATQWMNLSQAAIAQCLNMSESDIFIQVRRVGGAFGGKISRSAQVSSACALVAKLMNRPCRFILPMTTNLTIAGKRPASQCEYEVGVDDDGKIQYLEATMIGDAGCSKNDNVLILVAGAFPNCYTSDNFSLKTYTVLTDLPSTTAFRAPGSLEAIASIEHIMEHIAFAVGKDPTDVRLANMRTKDNDIPTLIETLKKEADYDTRYKEIQQFNKANRWVKKAISIDVMLFPVITFGNYNAVVTICRGDGSVTVSTGGVEMGQGANTKVRQVVAHEFGITVDQVTILSNFSFIGGSDVFSGGSVVSECVCYASIQACDILIKRLKTIKDTLDNPTWLELIQKAGAAEVDLVAEYMVSSSDFTPYDAFVVSILEGELDVLTGKYILNRADLIEDAGTSINPAVDIGQIEGGYVQGLSYFTTEKLVFNNKTGQLLSNDGLSYEVYLAKDIPVDMRITLVPDSVNSKGLTSAKAVGEMSICASHGVMHVLRQCIMESRKESGYADEWINIDVPYTTESILKALNVKPSEFVVTK